MGAKNSTERAFKNLDKILGEDDDFFKKNKKDKKDKKDKDDKNDKNDKDDNRSLFSKPIVKGGCKQCALKNK